MSLFEFNNDSNYIEVYLAQLENKNDRLDVYKTNLGCDKFMSLLDTMRDGNFKFFQKEYKEYIHKDIICQCYTNDEIKVFKKKSLKSSTSKHWLIVYNNKIKQTLLNFPSTTDLQCTSYNKKLIFRVNNRIYVNFKISLDTCTGNKWYEVYINYNHEENVDTQLAKNTLEEVMKMLESGLEPIY
jgi:hypothetical protein